LSRRGVDLRAPELAQLEQGRGDDHTEQLDRRLSAGETTVIIVLRDGNAAPSVPGTFTAFDPGGSAPPPIQSALLYTSILDATCGNDAADETASVSGSVTLTAVGGGVYAGQFDVVLDSGDQVTGSFDPAAGSR
jgi:hypothetical protein